MKKNKIFYILGIGFSILVIISILAFLTIEKSSKEELNKTAQLISEQQSSNAEQVSSSTDKKVEEIEQENVEQFSEIVEKDEIKQEEVNEVKVDNTQSVEGEEVNSTPTFIMPVEGEIIRNYAKDKLVYSDTLKEWVTHLGIDIKAPKTTVVKASSSGKIIAIKNDPRFGLSVVIEHPDGYSTIYSNLLTAEFVSVGEEVEQGETIGTVGNTAVFEILDEPHLHFEILKDGNQIDPNMYL